LIAKTFSLPRSELAIEGFQSFADCMTYEITAREQSLSIWRPLSVPDRGRCARKASSDGIASYAELIVCLQIASELDAK
jgi:hypothetical protein